MGSTRCKLFKKPTACFLSCISSHPASLCGILNTKYPTNGSPSDLVHFLTGCGMMLKQVQQVLNSSDVYKYARARSRKGNAGSVFNVTA